MKRLFSWIMNFVRKEWFLLIAVVAISIIILLFELL
jgi:hypothetical protein